MFENVGWGGGAGIAVGLMVAVSIIPTMILQWRGSRWHYGWCTDVVVGRVSFIPYSKP